MSLFLNSSSPPTILPGFGTRLSIERDVTLLPQPDSPTRQRISPSAISKLIPSTALAVPSEVKKYVLRF